MKYRTLDEIRPVADVRPAASPREIRRRRLERLAQVLERHEGPVRLLSRIEYYPDEDRRAWREDGSPLFIAFADPEFRREGLVSDRFGDVMGFFQLSWGDAQHVFCDCHFPGRVSSQMIADRVREIARGSMLRNMWDGMMAVFAPHAG